ncbi:unnamed protein product, partial [marine sediment metagenome]
IKISPINRATKGVEVDGLNITVFPAVMALRISLKGIRKGKFHGEITSVTPKGSN